MSVLVRLRKLEPSLVGRALTPGVHGIVIPQLNTADKAAGTWVGDVRRRSD